MSAGIGENIRRIRREKKITQKRLAEMTGLTNVVINYYEHGAKNPTIETVRKIADALGERAMIASDMSRALSEVFGILTKTDN